MPVEKKYLHDIDLVNNRLLNPIINPLTTAQRTTLAGILTALDEGYLAYDTTVSSFYFWDGAAWQTFTGGSAVWGGITGTITAQTDLINYLVANYYPLSSNPANYITSAALAPYLTSAAAASTYTPLNRNITINGVTQDLSIDRTWTIPTGGIPVALPFTTDHIAATGNPYLIGDVVYYLGNIYRCIAGNDSILPTNALYWTNLGAGYPLVQQPADWNSTSGNNQILNKPIIPTVTPSALTKVDDTNVTLTLTGTPSTALLQSVGLTLGWTGTLADSRIASAATWNAKVGGSGTATRVAFWDTSSSISSNSNFYWDNANNRLGIGTSTPTQALDVNGVINSSNSIYAGTTFYTPNSELAAEQVGGGISHFKVVTFVGNRPVYLSPKSVDVLAANDYATFPGGAIRGVGISDDGNPLSALNTYPSVLLGLNSTSRGFLLPRLTTAQKTAITLPETGLQVYDSTVNKPSYYNGSTWVDLGAGGGGGITSLNGLTGATQTFATGTTGTDFAISSVGTTHTFNLPIASATNTGKLSSTDWSTFNGKQAALNGTGYVKMSGTTVSYVSSIPNTDLANSSITIQGTSTALGGSVDIINGTGFVKASGTTITYDNSTYLTAAVTSIGTSAPLTGGTITSTGTIGITQATTSTDGYLSSTDWNTFNNKVSTSRTISTTAPLAGGGDLSANRTLSITQATTSTDGYLSSTDWNTFNGKQPAGSYITALTGDVTATGPGSVAATIANDAVTFAKMQNINTSKLLGRYSAGSGDVQEITISTGLSLDGSGNLTASGTSQWTTSGSNIYYTAGNVLVGSSTDNALGDALQVTGSVAITSTLKETVTLSAQSASYTLALTDRGRLVTMSVGSANNLTVPLNSSVAFPIGSKIDVIQIGTGITTIVATGGVTLLSNNSALRLNGQYAACTLIKVGTDTWYVIGNLIN